MQIDSYRTDEAQVIAVREDRVDAAVAVRFKDAVRAAVADGPARVVLDMGQVTFLDSSGLGAVVGARKLLAPERQLELAALTPPVAKVFKLTRMDTVFALHASAEAALTGNGPDARDAG